MRKQDCDWSRVARGAALLLGVSLATQPLNAAVHYERIKSFGNSALLGSTPYAGLVEGSDGALYGAAVNGGNYAGGTVFRITGAGTEFTVLHHFWASNSDGRAPQAALIRGEDGRLYGTTG